MNEINFFTIFNYIYDYVFIYAYICS